MAGDLSENVIRTDQRLERANEATSEQLAEHRWHWTLDESNPKRVGLRAYARSVNRSDRSVRDMVNGYVDWCNQDADRAVRTLSDCIQRAKVRGDEGAAIDAVATARGSSFGTVRRHHSRAVQTVRNMATARAERRGTTPAEELEGAARDHERARQGAKKRTADKKARHSSQYVRVEGELGAAMDALRKVFKTAEGVEFDAEERELIRHDVGKVRALLDLITTMVGGKVDVDWDAEMRKLVDS